MAKYPTLDDGHDTVRPFRIWHANDKEWVRYRYYMYPRNAHLGALIEARWAEPNQAFEVVDIRTSALLGQYRRTPTSVQFTAIKRDGDGPETTK